MKKTNKFSPEVRERAVRIVQEQRGEYLMHLLRWEGVRLAIEMDLRTLDSPIATGSDHAKVLAAFEPDWENREFYRFA